MSKYALLPIACTMIVHSTCKCDLWMQSFTLKFQELIGLAFNRLIRMDIATGDSLKTWRFSNMQTWSVNWEIKQVCKMFFFFFLWKFFWRTSVLFVGPLILLFLDFWWWLPWDSKPRVDPLACMLDHLCAIDPSDSPQVPHLLTSWRKLFYYFYLF